MDETSTEALHTRSLFNDPIVQANSQTLCSDGTNAINESDSAESHAPSTRNPFRVNATVLKDDLMTGTIDAHNVTAGGRSTSTPAPLSQAFGFFPQAHDFIQQNCTFVDVRGNYIVNHGLPTDNTDVVSDSTSTMSISYKICPPSTPLFTGRPKLLEDMEIYFANEVGTRHICVLHGLGGVGKSQLAYRFVELCAKKTRFSDVYFIDASTVDTLNTDLANIAIVKKVGKSTNDALRWLANQHHEWLILFNNADDVKLNLSAFFPRCSYGNILITTRNPELCIHAPDAGFRVPDLEPEEAITLLLTMASSKNSASEAARTQATAIAKELGYYPLAIVQAGAYILRTRNLSGYLELYHTNRARLWQAQPVQKHDDYERTVYTTWQMSVDLLSPEAVAFLRICSFLHHDSISEKMFKAVADAIPSCDASETTPALLDFVKNFLSDEDWDPFRFQDVVSDVQSYSLIDFDDANHLFSIHPLVHSWMRTTSEDYLAARDCARYLVALALRHRDDYGGYMLQRTLLPHIDAVVRNQDTIDSPFLLFKFALGYLDNGRLSDAEKLGSMVIKKAGHEEDSLYVMASFMNLAVTYTNQGRYDEAELLQLVVEEIFGEDHFFTLIGNDNLATTYRNQGRYDDAENLLIEVVEKSRAIFGEDDSHTLNSTVNLAMVYAHQRRYEEAERLYVVVQEASERALGVDHPLTLINNANLSITYWHQGRYDEAEKLQGAFESCKQLFAEDHPSTLHITSHQALMECKGGRYDEAEKLQVRAVEGSKRALGESHPTTLAMIAQLATIYGIQGRSEAAEKLQVTVLEASKRTLGEDHSFSLISMTQLAMTYSSQGKDDDAAQLQVTVVEAKRRVLGDDDPSTLSSMMHLAVMYWNLGRYGEAEMFGVMAVAGNLRAFGEDHPSTLNSMDSLALILRSERRPRKESEQLLVRAEDLPQSTILALRFPKRVIRVWDNWIAPKLWTTVACALLAGAVWSWFSGVSLGFEVF